MTDIERLAMTLLGYKNGRVDEFMWERYPRSIRDGNAAEVRAILTELREASESMANAGGFAWNESEAASDQELAQAAGRVFTAMIDHILTE